MKKIIATLAVLLSTVGFAQKVPKVTVVEPIVSTRFLPSSTFTYVIEPSGVAKYCPAEPNVSTYISFWKKGKPSEGIQLHWVFEPGRFIVSTNEESFFIVCLKLEQS